MATVSGIVLNAGKALITASMTGFSLFAPAKYELGSDAGFTPDPDDVSVRGTLLYTGEGSSVTARALSNDTARYTVIVAENVGPFNVGNIVIYGTMWDNTPVPLFSIVLSSAFRKEVTTSGSTVGDLPFPVPGSRFIVNVTIKHTLEASDVQVDIITPTFSSLAHFDDETSFPPIGSNPWTTFVLHNDTRISKPVLVTTRDDDTQWAVPFLQPIRHPKFGVIDGGMCGDNYSMSPHYIWGYNLTTPDDKYNGVIGGQALTEPDGNFVATIGGFPL